MKTYCFHKIIIDSKYLEQMIEIREFFTKLTSYLMFSIDTIKKDCYEVF